MDSILEKSLHSHRGSGSVLGAGEGGIMIALTEKHFTRSEDGQVNRLQPQAGARVGVCDSRNPCGLAPTQD